MDKHPIYILGKHDAETHTPPRAGQSSLYEAGYRDGCRAIAKQAIDRAERQGAN